LPTALSERSVDSTGGAAGALPRDRRRRALMYARSTTIKGDPGSIDTLIAFVRDEVMPAITALDGSVGLSLLVDRETGRCIATSSWETEEAREASRETLSGMRSRGAEILGGAIQIDDWEIAVMHRDHQVTDDSCCRVTWAQYDAAAVDRGVDYFRGTVLPMVESADGFCSASLMVDRATGRACGTVVFDSRAALEATRERAAEMRSDATRDAGTAFLDVAEFELAYGHLRVPELV